MFTSVAPGADMARLAHEHDVDLLLVDAPDGLLEDARVLALLDHAPCDVGVVVGGPPGRGEIVVPFAGAEHDWAAVELGAWLARSRGTSLRLAGATTGADGRDASRLLAHASIAVQRALGVPAEPVLVDPDPEALVEAAQDAGVVVVGLTDRWRREGLGRARTALATQTSSPTVLVRRGDAARRSRPARERDALHLDDRRLSGQRAQAGGVARCRAACRARAAEPRESRPPKVCSTPAHDAAPARTGRLAAVRRRRARGSRREPPAGSRSRLTRPAGQLEPQSRELLASAPSATSADSTRSSAVSVASTALW